MTVITMALITSSLEHVVVAITFASVTTVMTVIGHYNNVPNGHDDRDGHKGNNMKVSRKKRDLQPYPYSSLALTEF